jgi:hypothetical protein
MEHKCLFQSSQESTTGLYPEPIGLMCCWRRMGKISWTDRVRNKVLHTVKEERNIPLSICKKKANWIGHFLHRNCLLKHVIEGKLEGRIEMTGRRGRSLKQLLDDLKEKTGYWKLKEEALCGKLALEEAMDVS